MCCLLVKSKKIQCLGMSALPRHKHRQPRISAWLCQCPLPTCTPLVLQGEHLPQVPSPSCAGTSAEHECSCCHSFIYVEKICNRLIVLRLIWRNKIAVCFGCGMMGSMLRRQQEFLEDVAVFIQVAG